MEGTRTERKRKKEKKEEDFSVIAADASLRCSCNR
jgi:hypothetical protein